jgi:hypothetical protein
MLRMRAFGRAPSSIERYTDAKNDEGRMPELKFQIQENDEYGLSLKFDEYGDEDEFDDFIKEKVWVPHLRKEGSFLFGPLASKEKILALLGRFEASRR